MNLLPRRSSVLCICWWNYSEITIFIGYWRNTAANTKRVTSNGRGWGNNGGQCSARTGRWQRQRWRNVASVQSNIGQPSEGLAVVRVALSRSTAIINRLRRDRINYPSGVGVRWWLFPICYNIVMFRINCLIHDSTSWAKDYFKSQPLHSIIGEFNTVTYTYFVLYFHV